MNLMDACPTQGGVWKAVLGLCMLFCLGTEAAEQNQSPTDRIRSVIAKMDEARQEQNAAGVVKEMLEEAEVHLQIEEDRKTTQHRYSKKRFQEYLHSSFESASQWESDRSGMRILVSNNDTARVVSTLEERYVLDGKRRKVVHQETIHLKLDMGTWKITKIESKAVVDEPRLAPGGEKAQPAADDRPESQEPGSRRT